VTNQSRQELLDLLKNMKAYAKKRKKEASHKHQFNLGLRRYAEGYWEGQAGAYEIVQEYVWQHIKKEG
jgi:hypothetical protein